MRTIFVAAMLLLPLAVAATGAAHLAPALCPANARVISYGGAAYIWYTGNAPIAGLVPSPPTQAVNQWTYAESGAQAGLQGGDPNGHVVLDQVVPVGWGHEHRCQAAANWDYELY